MTPGEFDWDALRAEAVGVRGRAYAPYSSFPVGAAGVTADNQLVLGCNVENASYGLSLCAECGLLSQLHAVGAGPLTHLVVVDKDDRLLMPCGRCRQLLLENAGAALQVLTVSGMRRLGDLLPAAFGAHDL